MKFKILLAMVLTGASGAFGQRLDAPIFPLVTVGTLPSASIYSGVTLWVSDSSTGTCTSGSGIILIACRSNGTSWVAQGASSSAGGITQLTTDVAAGPGSGTQAATVKGLNTVPFCTGFTPTNGQSLQYTTGSSPNPCYTATTITGTGINQLTSDVTAGPGTGSQAATVKGINSVPLCAGFTPTTGQAVTYTTASSPNPCYTAVSVVGGGNLSNSGTPAIHQVGVFQSATTVAGIAPAATSGEPFCSGGASVDPAYCAVNLAGGSSIVSGTLPAANLPTATSGAKGVVQGDGSTITITSGVEACTTATSSQIGCAKPDNATLTVSAGTESCASASASQAGCAIAIPNATTTVSATAFGSNNCYSATGTLNTATTVTMTGLTTGMTLTFTATSDTHADVGWGATGGLVIRQWVTANTANFYVCNQSGTSQTPGSSVTFNISAR